MWYIRFLNYWVTNELWISKHILILKIGQQIVFWWIHKVGGLWGGKQPLPAAIPGSSRFYWYYYITLDVFVIKPWLIYQFICIFHDNIITSITIQSTTNILLPAPKKFNCQFTLALKCNKTLWCFVSSCWWLWSGDKWRGGDGRFCISVCWVRAGVGERLKCTWVSRLLSRAGIIYFVCRRHLYMWPSSTGLSAYNLCQLHFVVEKGYAGTRQLLNQSIRL